MSETQTEGATPTPAAASGRQLVDDWGALLIHHISKIKPLIKKQGEAAALAAAAATTVTEGYNYATADLKVTRKWLAAKIEQTGRDVRDLIAERELDDKANQVLGIAVQADLFAGEDTAAQTAIWFHQGYIDGVNGNEQDCSDPMFLQNYLQGYHAGQAVMAVAQTRGAEIIAEQGQPKTEPAVNLNPGEGDGGGDNDEELTEEQIQAKADALSAGEFGKDAPKPKPMVASEGGKVVTAEDLVARRGSRTKPH